MSKILDWIEKHAWQTVLIGFGMFFVPLFFVHIAYRIPAITPWFASTWESGEFITYIAGFEAFIGTVILGIIATKQNAVALDLNKRLLDIENASLRLEQHPNLGIECSGYKKMSYREIFNSHCLNYSCISNIDKFEETEDNWEIQFVLFSIGVSNHSGRNIKIKLDSLALIDAKDHSKVYVFNTTPIGLHPEIRVIYPETSSSINFMIELKDEFLGRLFKGYLEFSCLNNLNDTTNYSVLFSVLMSESDNSIKIAFILDDLKEEQL